jgi:hypothetical protein
MVLIFVRLVPVDITKLAIVFVPLAIPGNTKPPTISRGLRAPIGPPVPRAKKEQHQVQPPILLAALAPLAIFKLKLVTD